MIREKPIDAIRALRAQTVASILTARRSVHPGDSVPPTGDVAVHLTKLGRPPYTGSSASRPLRSDCGRWTTHFFDPRLMPYPQTSRTFGVLSFKTLISNGIVATRQRTLWTIAFIGIIASACQSPNQQPSGSSEALDTAGIRASIDSLGANVMRANQTGDAELYATTWAIDGILSDAGSPPVHGRDSIVARFRRRPPLPPGAKMTIHPTELRIQSDQWAHIMGVDTLSFTPPNAATPVRETFTFLVILRKTSEGWQTYREVLSANQ